MTLFLYLFGDHDACSHYNYNTFCVVNIQVGYRPYGCIGLSICLLMLGQIQPWGYSLLEGSPLKAGGIKQIIVSLMTCYLALFNNQNLQSTASLPFPSAIFTAKMTMVYAQHECCHECLMDWMRENSRGEAFLHARRNYSCELLDW